MYFYTTTNGIGIMSNKSNDKGRAYEYVYLVTLYEEISKVRKAIIEQNSSYYATKRAWETLSDVEKNTYKISALAGMQVLFDTEPLILDDEEGVVELKIQPDSKGTEGDVRDVLIIKQSINWEIGLSLKHNHEAVKHSRLAKTLDFGSKWYGIKCSNQYWKDIEPIFDSLDTEHQNSKKWNELR